MSKFKKRLLRLVVTIVVIALLWAPVMRLFFGIAPPEGLSSEVNEICDFNAATRVFGNNKLRQSESGLWEMYLEGAPFERGKAFGILAKDLLKYQEDVFVEQIQAIVPSKFYLRFLRDFTAIYNRKLPKNITDEIKEEIYGISLSCTHNYDFIGTPYERQLNYHAAHDLGHAMQDYMIVGCTSFAATDCATTDSSLIIGRNFDFYVGDKFAENKIIAFYNPENGYKFASVTWAGMTGVLSGMNEKGITVTINAAKSDMPGSSATPISVLCREILQYSANISDAVAIANKRKTFVSEAILVGSGTENKAVIIEKSPEKTGIYTSSSNVIVCANHYQSDVFEYDERNIENIATSDSPYRQKRMEELIAENMPINHTKAANILRNRKGLSNKNIGNGNEKSVNQLICHHSVIFKPQNLLMWVSTSPWQLGEYVCYDLADIFKSNDFSAEFKVDSLTIKADDFLESQEYANFIKFRQVSREIKNTNNKSNFDVDAFISTNPEYYYVYELVGDYYKKNKKDQKAAEMYSKSLSKEIPKISERERIEKKHRKLID